ncbi:hypothetical protein HPB49_021349 [Dermacentor silvarum]|uniref:Uncharacterized protein n=1 Tax=Dermacentor silvarum TaxID=543639 RepID=A0ACB8DG34_DERSI|nr:hypothetical protein HPB49_021349 [Dermacentor silvarum]
MAATASTTSVQHGLLPCWSSMWRRLRSLAFLGYRVHLAYAAVSLDEPGSAFGTVYCPELGDCTNSTFQDRSALPWGNKTSAREIGKFSTDEPRDSYDDDNSDALLQARNAKKCGNALLDPLAVERGLWDDLQDTRCGPMVTAYGTVSVKRPPMSHAISVDRAVEVVNFYNH